jgi:hypothetical protein
MTEAEIKKKRTRKKRVVSNAKITPVDTVTAKIEPVITPPPTQNTAPLPEPLPPIIPAQVIQNLTPPPAKKQSRFDLMGFLGFKSEPKQAQQANTKTPFRIERAGGRKWWLIIAGCVFIVLGFVGMFSFMTSMSPMIGFISVMGWAIGGFAIYFGWKAHDDGVTFASNNPLDKARDKTFLANSMNIYRDKLAFENLPDDKLLGQPRLCRNDKKFYYVHIEGIAFGGKIPGLVQFVLPDTQYRDPREFANNINIPAHRRLAQRKANLLEKLSPLIIIFAMGIMGIVWVATQPPPPVPGTLPPTPITQQLPQPAQEVK